ncbi:hypothetical protein Bhyg_07259 [Pseudolycoriella hygida]|uniref:DUF5648 domain-containing protein n=1 Tax=Pseudolycoriella hygida TaxID=35572 RepID=A0A9Q0S1T9_9DIPT|nr:hypothetical protein Bhyg_07259 [Pseudolycoriella hygida]
MFKFSSICLIAFIIGLNCCFTYAAISSQNLVPLTRLHRIYDNYNFIATESDASYAVANNGFIRQNVIGSVVLNAGDSVNELKSIYRSYLPGPTGKDDHLFTYSDSEVNLAVNTVGYRYEGVRFYCGLKANDFNATIPLYRFWTGVRHLYTTNYTEGNAILVTSGVGAYENVLCYIWQ